VSAGDTVAAMARRLTSSIRRHHLDSATAILVESAFRDAVSARRPLAARESELLHPGRTVLILLEDAKTELAALLAAGALVESENADWAVPIDRVRAQYGDEVASLVAAVPRPAEHADDLLESLLCAPVDAQRIALAEQLDHARHLHLRPPALWVSRHEMVRTAYLPIAARTDAVLERRLHWWQDMFERRFLRA
jgi:hypothetical protein